MVDERLREIIREEVVLALRALSIAANGLDMPYETSELDSRALSNIEQAADRAAHEYKELCEAADEEADPVLRARDVNPFAPDLTMSREAADLILRSIAGLLEEGYWPKGYDVDGRHGGKDTGEFDGDLVQRAADIVGRDKIVHGGLRRYLAELDANE